MVFNCWKWVMDASLIVTMRKGWSITDNEKRMTHYWQWRNDDPLLTMRKWWSITDNEEWTCPLLLTMGNGWSLLPLAFCPYGKFWLRIRYLSTDWIVWKMGQWESSHDPSIKSNDSFEQFTIMSCVSWFFHLQGVKKKQNHSTCEEIQNEQIMMKGENNGSVKTV